MRELAPGAPAFLILCFCCNVQCVTMEMGLRSIRRMELGLPHSRYSFRLGGCDVVGFSYLVTDLRACPGRFSLMRFSGTVSYVVSRIRWRSPA